MAVYLGGMLSCDGRAQRELHRRLGEGRRVLQQVSKLWAHAGITRERKLQIYMSCVVSKILYSLESLWLLKNDLKKLDAFHQSCLRRMLRILPSFLSHVPNSEVLSASHLPLLSEILRQRQIELYVRVANMPENSLVRSLTCTPTGLPRVWALRRRRGRPRQMWAQEVYSMSVGGRMPEALR